jgi:hypothetical protein
LEPLAVEIRRRPNRRGYRRLKLDEIPKQNSGFGGHWAQQEGGQVAAVGIAHRIACVIGLWLRRIRPGMLLGLVRARLARLRLAGLRLTMLWLAVALALRAPTLVALTLVTLALVMLALVMLAMATFALTTFTWRRPALLNGGWFGFAHPRDRLAG